MEKHNYQHSDTLKIGFIMAFIGGFQTAYTYYTRDKVFANFQTGNMLRLCESIVFGDKKLIINYLTPILCFGLGVAISTTLKKYLNKKSHHMHYRSIILLIECLILLIVSFIPNQYNLVASSLVSFNAAVSTVLFQHFHGLKMPSTMMIGNYVNTVSHFTLFLIDKNNKEIKQSLLYLTMILIFLSGAIGGFYFSIKFNNYAILLCIPLLILIIIYMELDKIKE